MHLVAKSLRRRLAGLLQAVAAPVEQPTVVKTAKPAVFDAAVAQVGAPVRTMTSKQTELPLVVPKQNEIFTQDPHRQRGAVRR